MFNQKVNGHLSQNKDHLNYSYGAPNVSSRNIHNCGTTINKYTKSSNCSSLPLQSWCSANVAVESFGMRPIVNSKDYFENINNYLASIVYTDSVNLKNSGMSRENYSLYTHDSKEPMSSFISAIQLEITDKLQYYMGASADQVGIFKNYNPISEGFVITDIDISTYRSREMQNHFFHRVIFSAFNTTRYNTVSFKADLYQDTTPMMYEWNKSINEVLGSKDTPIKNNARSTIYVALITLLNNTTCVTGQESDCEFKGYNLSSSFSQLINDNFLKEPSSLQWIQPDAIIENTYNNQGNYDQDGNIMIKDYGPKNLDQLIKNLK
jgi:hypothetical protein